MLPLWLSYRMREFQSFGNVVEEEVMKGFAVFSAAVAACAGATLTTKYADEQSSGRSFWRSTIPVKHASAEQGAEQTKHQSLENLVLGKCKLEMVKSGSPGLVIGVSINGETVLSAGLGFSDIENRIQCHKSTVMRIASISKSLTMAAVAKAYEDGKIDFDKSIHEYLPDFPTKIYEGQEVKITTRHLVSHLGGIRHYDKKKEKGELDEKKKEKVEKEEDEFERKEYYLKDAFKTIDEALELFKHDELHHEPGSKFLYTTHGWTLVSAVLEKAVGKDFRKIMTEVFHDLGLRNTRLDENEPIIMNRARFYVRNKKGKLVNAPFVDNSYKWAGGGFLSTVDDLVKFGNSLLYSYQRSEDDSKHTLPGYLKSDTIKLLWSSVDKTKKSPSSDTSYGMGWFVVPKKKEIAFGNERRFQVYHTGGAVGASSVLLVTPSEESTDFPRGVVVAIITNMQSVGLNGLAKEIAEDVENWYKLRMTDPRLERALSVC